MNYFKYLRIEHEKKNDALLLLVFTLLIIITRIPFVSKFLYEWDSINYALGFEKYDIVHHQPHPPGYILFVGLGRVINTIFNDPNTTMVFISIFFSILTVLLIYFLAKQMLSREIAIITAILLIFNPLFWFYGEIATIYPSEAFFATLIAYLSYQVLRGNEKYFYVSTLALGLAGGFRQDLVVFMFPLWLFCLFYLNRDYKRIIKAFGILIPSILVWFIPTILLAGGYMSYSYASGLLFEMCIPRNSLIFGVSLLNKLSNVGAFLSWTVLGLSFFGMFIIALFLIYHKEESLFSLIKVYIKNKKVIFLILWIIPASLFYLFVHLSKPGYLLVYIPAFTIIIGYILKQLSLDINARFKNISARSILAILLLLSILFNATYFLFPYNINEEYLWETPLSEMNPAQQVIWGLEVGFMYNNEKIRSNDKDTKLYLNAIKNITDSNSENTLIVMGDISRINEGFSWRKAMYYLPNYDIYYLIESENYVMSPWYGKNHTNNWSEAKTLEIPVDPSTEKIIWIMSNKSIFFNQVQSQTEIKTINLPNGLKIYYSDIKGKESENNKFIFQMPTP